MNWSNRFSWLSAWKLQRVERRSTEPDHGDMGTAFGLDASFGPIEDEAPPAPLPPAGTPPWEHRLTRRTSL